MVQVKETKNELVLHSLEEMRGVQDLLQMKSVRTLIEL